MLLTLSGRAKTPKPEEPTETTKPAPRPRQRKAERGFSPDDSGLRPSEYRLAERLIWHFAKTRNDKEYGDRWEAFLLEQRAKALADAHSLREWRARQNGPAPLRVRASELKDCARKQTFRLLNFTPAPIPTKWGHWNVSAAVGSDLHALVEAAIEFFGFSKRSEFAVRTGANDFSGRVDSLIDGSKFTPETDWADDEDEGVGPYLNAQGTLDDAVLDIKTVGPDDFAEGAWGKKVSGYIAQVSAYARLLGVNRGVVLLVDRGSGKMMDFAWDVDPAYADGQLQRAAEIVKTAKRGELGEAEDWDHENEKMSSTCFLFCPFKDYCTAEQERGVVTELMQAGVLPAEISEQLKWKPGGR